jgi:DNA-binding transcriptional LysR family regulator
MRRYTVPQLEAFAAISDCGSFRIAADRLGITQPSISLRIRELEVAIGCALFVRGKGGVRLSETGQIMLQYVQRGLDVFDEMELRLRTGDPLSGVLRLGSSNTFALSCLPAVLAALEKSHPKLQVELTINNSNTLRSLLDQRKVDIAFLVDASTASHITIEPLAKCEIGWFAKPGERIGSRSIRPQVLAARRIVTLPPPSPFHTLISDWFTAAKLPLPTLNTCNDMATIVRLVRNGVAISVLPLCIVESELLTSAIIRYRTAPALPSLTICAAYQASARGRSSELILHIARNVVAHAGAHLRPIGLTEAL